MDVGPGAGVDAAALEVPEKPQRRRFTAEYKIRILREVEACNGPGDVGALLRREGLYTSHLSAWRQQRERGVLEALAPKRRGPKARRDDPLVTEVAQLRRENTRLERKLKQAALVIAIQKKASEMLGIPLKTVEDEENDW